jgi:hypothetical protein
VLLLSSLHCETSLLILLLFSGFSIVKLLMKLLKLDFKLKNIWTEECKHQRLRDSVFKKEYSAHLLSLWCPMTVHNFIRILITIICTGISNDLASAVLVPWCEEVVVICFHVLYAKFRKNCFGVSEETDTQSHACDCSVNCCSSEKRPKNIQRQIKKGMPDCIRKDKIWWCCKSIEIWFPHINLD